MLTSISFEVYIVPLRLAIRFKGCKRIDDPLPKAMGANVISASGTTGTTNRTRAVGFISTLSKAWGLKYSPIIGGMYHAAILPIVLLEMEVAGNSFLGAIDMTGLVMVSAGITLANVIAPRDKSETAVAFPGFLINVFFGTFVKAAYPFMFSDKRFLLRHWLSAVFPASLWGHLT